MTDAMNEVLQLRQQGMTDNQIVQQLQSSGMSTQNIFDALSQADVGSAAMPPPPGAMPGQMAMPPPPGMASMPSPPGMAPMGMPPMQQMQPMQSQVMHGDDRIQEVAEQIINEKWEEVIKEVQKVVGWKSQVESDIQTMQETLKSLKEEFNQLRQGVLGRINESDDVVRNVSSELKAVHKVFKDVIPTFTENVAELSRLTGHVKPVKRAVKSVKKK